MPLNAWPRDERMKHLGELSEENWLQGLGGFTMGPFNRVLEWTKEQIEVCLFLLFCSVCFFHLSEWVFARGLADSGWVRRCIS